MDTSVLKEIQERLLDIWRGMNYGTIKFSWNKCDCAMGTNPCEEFDDVAGSFVVKVECGEEVTNDELCSLYNNLVSYNEIREVKELEPVIKDIKQLLG